MRWVKLCVVAGVLTWLGWWLWQRVFVTDETRIKRALAQAVKAVEAGNLFRLEGFIAQDYSDHNGFDKTTVLGAVRQFRQGYNKILIFISDLRITLAPDHQTAEAVLIAKVVAVSAGQAESEVRADRLRLHFRKGDQGWQLVRAESPELKFD